MLIGTDTAAKDLLKAVFGSGSGNGSASILIKICLLDPDPDSGSLVEYRTGNIKARILL